MKAGLFSPAVWRILLPERGQWGELGLVMVLTGLMASLEALAAAALGPFIALVQSPDAFAASRLGRMVLARAPDLAAADLIPLCGGIVIGLFALKTLVTLAQTHVAQRYTQDFFTALSTRLLSGYLHMPWEFHLASNSAVLIRNVTTETRLIVDNAVLQLINLAAESLVLVFLLATLVLVDARMALTLVGAAAILLVGLRAFGKRVGHHYGVIRDRSLADLGKLAQSTMLGVREIKIAGSADDITERFRETAAVHARATAAAGVLQVVPRVVLEALAIVGVLVVVLVQAGEGGGLGGLPTLAVFAAAGYRLLPSVNRLFVAGLMFNYVLPSLANMAPSLQAAIDRARAEGEGTLPTAPEFDRLEAVGVAYAYPGAEDEALSGLDFRLDRGRSIGLVGESGAGKSTLVALLTGLVKPARGEIRLNGRAIVTEDDVRRLHACLAYVAQATFIADDTLLANIVLDARHRGVDQARLARALRIAQLDGLVAELPDGLETRVGERGARLSGGQTQRIGIARALYLDRPVLILDEATSALDPATENRFVAALNHELAGRTLLVISHRPAALAGCAEIRRIAAGRLSAPIPYDEVVGAPPEPEPRSS